MIPHTAAQYYTVCELMCAVCCHLEKVEKAKKGRKEKEKEGKTNIPVNAVSEGCWFIQREP